MVLDACNPRGTRQDFDPILSIRLLSSSSRRRGGYRKFQLDALPFSVTVDEALKKFERWSQDEGIVTLLSLGSTKITPSRSRASPEHLAPPFF